MEKLNFKKAYKVFSLVFFSVLLVGLSIDCSNPKSKGIVNANIPPKTRLSNVPPLDVVSSMDKPRVSLNWVGDDPDGYVVGFRYTWTYPENGVQKTHPYKYILNIIVDEFALMVETQDIATLPIVYKYFSTLPSDVGLDVSLKDSLARGDSIWVKGVRVYASNPDSIKIQTGERIRYLYPIHVNPNSGTFIFDSPDSVNLHEFRVAAIDDQGAPSLTPATVSFKTPSVIAPKTKVESYPTISSLVISESTATFRGIQFTFKGTDPNSRTIDYRWVVDKDKWLATTGTIPWSGFSFHEYAWVQASDFPDPFDTVHTFYVQSRNEFGAIDTVGFFRDTTWNDVGDSIIATKVDSAWVKFRTSYPTFRNPNFPKTSKILLINNSQNGNGTPAFPYRDELDSFYIQILTDIGISRSDISIFRVGVNPPDGPGFPTREYISEYPYVILYGDIMHPAYLLLKDSLALSYSRQSVLTDYCYVGGRVIIGGWGLLRPQLLQPPSSDEGFPDLLLHVNYSKASMISKSVPDCIGATGVIGYPDLDVDTAKLDTAWHGGLAYIVSDYPSGFGENIQQYKSRSGNTTYNAKPVSVRYKGITFNTVYFGVPLYYMQRPGVDSALAMAIRDIKDNTYINNGTKQGN
jgi:hypothetical protein